MSKTNKEEFDVEALNEENEPSFTPAESPVPQPQVAATPRVKTNELVSCLRPVKVQVKYLKRSNGVITDPKHALFGGMAETSAKYFSVPVAANGTYVDVLTKDEKAYLEYVMQLPVGALSIYNKTDNFWDTFFVELRKESNFFDLSDPMDYIRVKVLKANKNVIASSLSEYQSIPKATYKFVCIEEGEEDAQAMRRTSVIQNCWKEYGKIEENKNKLQFICETMENGRPLGNQSLVWLQSKVTDYITSDAKTLYAILKDPLLEYKVLLKTAVKAGVVACKSNLYYIDGSPLCENNEESNLGKAAKYLSSPAHQPVLAAIKAKIKKTEND